METECVGLFPALLALLIRKNGSVKPPGGAIPGAALCERLGVAPVLGQKLAVAAQPGRVEITRLDRGKNRASRLRRVGAVAETATLRELGNLGEDVVECVVDVNVPTSRRSLTPTLSPVRLPLRFTDSTWLVLLLGPGPLLFSMCMRTEPPNSLILATTVSGATSCPTTARSRRSR